MNLGPSASPPSTARPTPRFHPISASTVPPKNLDAQNSTFRLHDEQLSNYSSPFLWGCLQAVARQAVTSTVFNKNRSVMNNSIICHHPSPIGGAFNRAPLCRAPLGSTKPAPSPNCQRPHRYISILNEAVPVKPPTHTFIAPRGTTGLSAGVKERRAGDAAAPLKAASESAGPCARRYNAPWFGMGSLPPGVMNVWAGTTT